jgi:hypothetical protein
MDQTEFEFPDEKELKEGGKVEAKNEFDLEIEDDTPPEDRGREPLPKELVQELEQDELEDYSEKVKTRLKQMKKVWHDERREKDQALREQREAIAYAQRMQEENRALKGRLTAGEQTYLDTYKTAAEMELDNAKRSYREAYDAGDTDKLIDAQEKITNANYKLQKAREYVPSLQNEKDSVKDNPEVQVPRPDPRAAAWQERNTWFGKDEEMTSLALGLHQKLVKEHGSSYTSTDEYWIKVDDTMRRRFPDYFQETTQPVEKSGSRTEKSNTVVAPATRSTGSKKILLKQSQLSIAKKLGLTPEQYVREMMKMEAKNG